MKTNFLAAYLLFGAALAQQSEPTTLQTAVRPSGSGAPFGTGKPSGGFGGHSGRPSGTGNFGPRPTGSAANAFLAAGTGGLLPTGGPGGAPGGSFLPPPPSGTGSFPIPSGTGSFPFPSGSGAPIAARADTGFPTGTGLPPLPSGGFSGFPGFPSGTAGPRPTGPPPSGSAGGPAPTGTGAPVGRRISNFFGF